MATPVVAALAVYDDDLTVLYAHTYRRTRPKCSTSDLHPMNNCYLERWRCWMIQLMLPLSLRIAALWRKLACWVEPGYFALRSVLAIAGSDWPDPSTILPLTLLFQQPAAELCIDAARFHVLHASAWSSS